MSALFGEKLHAEFQAKMEKWKKQHQNGHTSQLEITQAQIFTIGSDRFKQLFIIYLLKENNKSGSSKINDDIESR